MLFEEPVVIRTARFQPFCVLTAAFKIAIFGAAGMIVIETVFAHTVAVLEAFAECASPSLGIEFALRVLLAD